MMYLCYKDIDFIKLCMVSDEFFSSEEIKICKFDRSMKQKSHDLHRFVI